MRELRLEDDTFAELSTEILRQGGSFQFRAHGSSMVPFVRDGDLLTVEPADAGSLEIGDVVLYRTPRDRIVAHRIVSKSVERGEWTLVTRGDARLSSDGPVPADWVLGRVVRAQRGDRVYRLDRGPWRRAAHLWNRALPLRRAQVRLVRGLQGVALRVLQTSQSLAPYRRLARKTVGARTRFRPAQAADGPALARLFGSQSLPGVHESIRTMAGRIASEQDEGFALIATVGDRPAGGVIVRRMPDGDRLYPGWWLLGPVVRARYRRVGIGAELLRLALQQAADADARWLYLLAYEDDGATRSLAQKAGFLPASLPLLQARLDQPTWPGERRRIILSCALPSRQGRT